MENNIDIKKWCKWFKRIMKKYDECTNLIGGLIKQKNALNSNLERQNSDDIMFYNSILQDSIYYFKKSMHIRRLKFINDISELNKFFDSKRMNLDYINLVMFWSILADYFKELSIKNNQDLKWIKDDSIISLVDWKKDLEFTLNYHYYVIDNFYKTLLNELSFYQNTGEIDLLDKIDEELKKKRKSIFKRKSKKDSVTKEPNSETNNTDNINKLLDNVLDDSFNEDDDKDNK
tara:strand:+ start:673 stop:1368 length:696 start_codon:yes stop_codon:yes gene_type:complete